MKEALENFVGGAVIGLIALALDYFWLQNFWGTPIARAGGVTFLVVLLYLIVPFLILQFTRRPEGSGAKNG